MSYEHAITRMLCMPGPLDPKSSISVLYGMANGDIMVLPLPSVRASPMLCFRTGI